MEPFENEFVNQTETTSTTKDPFMETLANSPDSWWFIWLLCAVVVLLVISLLLRGLHFKFKRRWESPSEVEMQRGFTPTPTNSFERQIEEKLDQQLERFAAEPVGECVDQSHNQAGAELEVQMSSQPDEHAHQAADETKWVHEFRPEDEDELKENQKLDEWIRDTAEYNTRQRAIRVAIMFATAVIFLLLVNYLSRHAIVGTSEIQLMQMYGIILGVIYIVILSQFFYFWCYAYFSDEHGLFRVYTLNCNPTS